MLWAKFFWWWVIEFVFLTHYNNFFFRLAEWITAANYGLYLLAYFFSFIVVVDMLQIQHSGHPLYDYAQWSKWYILHNICLRDTIKQAFRFHHYSISEKQKRLRPLCKKVSRQYAGSAWLSKYQFNAIEKCLKNYNEEEEVGQMIIISEWIKKIIITDMNHHSGLHTYAFSIRMV